MTLARLEGEALAEVDMGFAEARPANSQDTEVNVTFIINACAALEVMDEI